MQNIYRLITEATNPCRATEETTMHLEVNRICSDSDTTIGVMTLDDKFVGFTCEDEFRWDKLPKETRIPS